MPDTLNAIAHAEAPVGALALPSRSLPQRRPSILVYYVVEGITSHSVALMLASIYFFTTSQFGWRSGQNYLLAAALGVVYVAGALSAHAVAVRLGRQQTLVACYLVMSALAWAAVLGHRSPWALVPLLLVYSGVSAVSWPALESLVSCGAEAGELSRRLGVYNCVWSGTGAVTVALAGLLLKYWPTGNFVIPAAWHVLMALLVWWVRSRDRAAADDAAADAEAAVHVSPEPELLRVRTLALWMSRLALPATFVVVSSLLAAMPTLPLIQRLDPTARTAVGSVWMAARWVAFLALGATVWWHTRPRALLTAALLLLAGFLAVTLRPEWLPGASQLSTASWLVWIVAWQVVLGMALGLIYSASLYFGMVLSDGSTEHGGYHEALIGLGTVIGPGAGALAELAGGGDPLWGVLAVALVLGWSVVACGLVAARRATG